MCGCKWTIDHFILKRFLHRHGWAYYYYDSATQQQQLASAPIYIIKERCWVGGKMFVPIRISTFCVDFYVKCGWLGFSGSFWGQTLKTILAADYIRQPC